VDERFVRLNELGYGGMSVVYRAFDAIQRREVALKVIRPRHALRIDGIQRFFREARTLRGLRHPNIVAPLHFGCTDQGLLYLSLQLLSGDSLADILSKSGPLPVPRALALVQQAAEALATVHRCGVLHRDLKPENFRVLPGDLLKMLDFGIATRLGEEDEPASPRVRQVCGTPPYMSPERVLGEREDEASDLYGLGTLLFEMLAGAPPFSGPDPIAVARQHLVEAPPALSDVAQGSSFPEELEALVEELLRKEPAQRPKSAMEVIRRIRMARRSLIPTSAESSSMSLATPFHERPTLLLPAAADAEHPTLADLGNGAAATLHNLVTSPGELHRGASAGPPPAADEILAATVGKDPRWTTQFAERPRISKPKGRAVDCALLVCELGVNAYGVRIEVDEHIEAWKAHCERQGGHVCLDTGSELRVVWGLPTQVHSPASAALSAARALRDLSRASARPYLFRAGLCTAPVFVDPAAPVVPAWALRGSEPELAARLCAAARPGEVLVDHRTRDCTRHLAQLTTAASLPRRASPGPEACYVLSQSPQPGLDAIWQQTQLQLTPKTAAATSHPLAKDGMPTTIANHSLETTSAPWARQPPQLSVE
jgi:serine/threonine protein kinase